MSDWKVLDGDCLQLMADMDDNSVDLICTDPPYGLTPNNPRRGGLGGGGKAAADEFDADPSAVADLADIEAPTEDVEGGTDLDSLLS